ncbi:Flp pilus assembly protein CpaB [Pseudoxanthomonas broegbernensis]|uniref:Flp pilus assembly protein CpaB n=1 Tax=Pseudoxanthomonas broegbernensis TaxID=83619 RepID=A0A7V8GKY9_9GAMM|nr:Flp pilus assembly protein CpaB [Pseudoxanthomonas broegbernensis]KAF1685439.1 Flp pilus assembly protein CpaB [Pseudoxanthomonas broegbernensis]MBB6064430.1 pilus assembly protein CpaB [Pseudoxanthomonas broegbernensis]
MYKVIRIVALLLVAMAVILAATALMLGRRSASAPAASAPAAAAPPSAKSAHHAIAAAKNLPAGIALERDDVEEVAVAQQVAGGFALRDDLVGAIPLDSIPAGTPLSRAHFAHGVSALLVPGERALAIPVDELAGAGNRIVPGDYVDVFLSLRPNTTGGERAAPQTRLLLSRLRVLGYGAMDLAADAGQPAEARAPAPHSPAPADRRAQAIASSGSGAPPEPERKAQSAARTALLAVPVAQVNALLLGAQNGKLFLGLRHPGDTGIADASLFPAPRPVLTPQAGLSEAQRKAALDAPENHAFSGIDLPALSGQDQQRARPTPPPARRNASREAGIEIIRGDGRGSHAQRL